MKNHRLRVASVFSLVLFALGIPRARAEEPFDTVSNYMEALQVGDTGAVKSCIGGRLYERKELLLDQNEEYPDFLRNYYAGAEFQVSDELTDLGPRGQGVAVRVRFPDGNHSESMAVVGRLPDGSWKIVDEVEASP